MIIETAQRSKSNGEWLNSASAAALSYVGLRAVHGIACPRWPFGRACRWLLVPASVEAVAGGHRRRGRYRCDALQPDPGEFAADVRPLLPARTSISAAVSGRTPCVAKRSGTSLAKRFGQDLLVLCNLGVQRLASACDRMQLMRVVAASTAVTCPVVVRPSVRSTVLARSGSCLRSSGSTLMIKLFRLMIAEVRLAMRSALSWQTVSRLAAF